MGERDSDADLDRVDSVLNILIEAGLAGSNFVGTALTGNEAAMAVIVGPQLKGALSRFENRNLGGGDSYTVLVDNREVNCEVNCEGRRRTGGLLLPVCDYSAEGEKQSEDDPLCDTKTRHGNESGLMS